MQTISKNFEQISIFELLEQEESNPSPCPYREDCKTYRIGCGGISFWCNKPGGFRYETRKTLTLIIKYFDDRGIFYQDRREIPDEGNKGISKAVIEWREANRGKYYFWGIETERKG